MSSDLLAKRILSVVQARGYKPQQVGELAEAMGVGEDEQGDFHAACKALMKTGRVVLGSRNSLMLPDPPGKVVGVFRGNMRGFGFIIPDVPNAHGDLYVPAGATSGAMTGDTVSAKVHKRGKRGGRMLYEGRIHAILKRGQQQAVGQLSREFGRWFVIPDGNVMHVPIRVGDAKVKGAQPGDQVVVEIIQYPTGQSEARGVVVKVLGKHGRPGVDTLSIIEQYQLPGDFDEAVLQDAREAATGFDPKIEANEREVLSKLTVITIDPDDAKDFDDAVSVTRNAGGTFELGVHIADVARFVTEGGPIDQEARERSNSVYLPGTVIPMLPEILSNGVCSLQERQPRLTKSVFISYDRRGRVKRVRLANTMIRSTKRLTYEQATRILDGKRGRTSAKVVVLLKEMERLARLIHARRRREGMLELELPEIDLIHDERGRVVGVKPAETSYSHKIIEMFMVEANEAVAGVLRSQDVPFLSRVHDEPKGLAEGTLQRFLRAFGHDLPARPDRFAIQKLLEKVHGTGECFTVHLAVLRSMQQAEYSPLHLGHYALASKHYCHFTSPIRRYPDLTIHRLVDSYLEGQFSRPAVAGEIPNEEELFTLGSQCSANERRSEAAGRELKLVLMLRWLERHLGDEFDGIVTGVANVGVFVQLEPFLIDGLLRFDQLPDDWWEVDAVRGAVVGERSGRRIRVGDRMRVVISKIHIPTRRLDIAPVAPQAEEKKRKATAQKSAPRRRTTGSKQVLQKGKGGRSSQPRRRTKPRRTKR